MNEWQDIDKEETREWQDAILAVIAEEGPERAHFLLENLIDQARRNGAHLPYSANTAYVNSIPPMAQKPMPGNAEYEHKIVLMCAGTPWRWWCAPIASRVI